VDDGDPLRLWPLWLFDEPVQIIRDAGQQHNRALEFKRRGGNDSVDGAAMTRKACPPE
jgi:hypothetical protein